MGKNHKRYVFTNNKGGSGKNHNLFKTLERAMAQAGKKGFF